MSAAFESLQELREGPAGTLRLTIPRMAYRQVIEPMLANFLAAHPRVQLELAIEDAFANIIERGFDPSRKNLAPKLQALIDFLRPPARSRRRGPHLK